MSPHHQDLNPLMPAGLRSHNPDLKEEIATFVAGPGIGQIAALRGYRTRVLLQLEYSAPTTLREAEASLWPLDEALHLHPKVEAEAVFRQLEDAGLVMGMSLMCMLSLVKKQMLEKKRYMKRQKMPRLSQVPLSSLENPLTFS